MQRRRRFRNTLGACAVAALPLAPMVATTAGATPAAADQRVRTGVSAVGTYAVGQITETFVDTSRPTPAFGTFAGAPERTIETVISYPAEGTYVEDQITPNAKADKAGAPYPLIVFGHGFTGNASVYESIISEWVSAGYVVAAPNYPVSNTNAPGGNAFVGGISDVSHQPADASFVIDNVIELSQTKGNPLRGLVDKKHIGASGHSGGGITTLGLVYADCCLDKRVDAAAPMSALAGLVADGNTYFDGIDTPLLELHGDSDGIVPYRTGVDAYTRAEGPKFLVTFTGAGHVTPFVGAEGPQGDVLVGSSVAFWDRYLKGDRDGLDRLRETVDDPAVATLQEQERPT